MMELLVLQNRSELTKSVRDHKEKSFKDLENRKDVER